jgi:hypothetical protein
MLKSGYNAISRVLHRIALQPKVIAEISFDIENTLVNKKDATFPDNHLFISGLARSGTTILLQYLYETGLFRSLTYLDMPFLLMPNIWKSLAYKKKPSEYKERAHQDGIIIGFDSPEAFEELFWRVFCGEKYICNDRLKLHDVDEEILKKFKDYIGNILLSGSSANQTRYLSKNNNNVMRFEALQKILPNSQIIIPFRNPLQHSISLLDQHLNFSKIHSEDKFSLDYMNWLGHFEFGLNQKPFFLNDEDTFNEMAAYDKTDINFWLLSWKNYYRYVNNLVIKNVIFFSYEQFCTAPTAVLGRLYEILDIEKTYSKPTPFEPGFKLSNYADKDLLEECNVIYNQLETKHNQWFEG